MNILIPHPWLLEHLDTPATPQEIQKILSLCGPSVERIYEREGEAVYDIEVTTNRVDSMSVRGIAREAAVILTQFRLPSTLRPLRIPTIFDQRKADRTLPLPTIVNDRRYCRRITCVVLDQLKRAETPTWMAKRLRQVELNVHDAVIDITNYVTHDLGHPCHAFDYDKIMELGGTIIVKLATPGQKFVTLDGATFTTIGGELVFENDQGEIIDLPGIKGTANTSIQADTQRVLFFTENSLPEKIRFASMSHSIRTVAAQLNEKNVDPHLALPVVEAGTQLFVELCGASVASPLFDEFPGQRQLPSVDVSLEHIAQYLGLELPVNRMAEMLEALGCQVLLKKKIFTVQPPTFRPDIAIPADVIEEIARIYGYHNLPSVLMPTAIPLTHPPGLNFSLENKIKRFLAAIGWQEVYTYSMVSQELALQSGQPLADHLKILNPLTDDRVYMRRSLLPSLTEILAKNTQYLELSVFELANTYHPREQQLPIEKLHLGLVSRRPVNVVKGDLEALAKTFFTLLRYQQASGSTADILAWSATTPELRKIGTLQLISEDVVGIDLLVETILEIAGTHPQYQPLAKTSPVIEDLTFTLPEKVGVGEVLRTLEISTPVVSAVEFINQYQQNVSFRITYHNLEKQVTLEAVTRARKQLVQAAQTEHHAQLVGELQ